MTETTHKPSNGHTAGAYEGEHLPPHSQEVEDALLGSILIDPDILPAMNLTPQMFFVGFNRTLCKVLLKLKEEKKAIDVITIVDDMRALGVDDAARVIGLINAVPTSINARSYLKIVTDLWVRRQLISVGGKIATLSYDPAEDLHSIISRGLDGIRQIGGDASENDPVSAYIAAGKVLELVTHRRENKDAREQSGLSLGFIDLDRILGGLEGGDLVIGAGRPGMGKSLVGAAVSANVSKVGKRVYIFNLEMSTEQTFLRMICSRTGIEYRTLINAPHTISVEKWASLNKAIGELSESDIYFDDTPSISVSQLEAKCHKLASEVGPPDLVMIDYLQLMTCSEKAANRREEIGLISRGLKRLARDFNCVVLALAQVNRAVEYRSDKHPTLADLRESGDIEQDADVVMFFYREVVYLPDSANPHVCDVDVAKHRNGPVGMCQVYFNAEKMLIRNLSTMGSKEVVSL